MKQRFTVCLLIVFSLPGLVSRAQNVAGYWLGITYPTDPNQVVYNYTMTLTQTGSVLGGTAQTANPNVPFGGVVNISGQVTGSTVNFQESDKNGSTAVKDLCFWRGTVTYNPVDESLTGTYQNIANGTTCTDSTGGNVELYRIVLKSGTTYCKNSPINLVVTGKNIRWYSSPNKTAVLATGNTYSPKISQTTTFYITQTLYKNESPAVPITVNVIEPVFNTTVTNVGCDKANGSIAVAGVNSTDWLYSLNGGGFQKTALFTSLGPGTYTVAVKDATGCQATQSVTLSADSSPTISDLKITPPHCESANGEVTLVPAGGKSPLTYSIDYGVTFQASPLFTKLPGGTYTLRVRDANGCEVNRAVTMPSFKPMETLSTNAVPTTCGQANGQAAMTAGGGIAPVTYSIDNRTFQASTIFTGLKAGSYTLSAKDGQGCTISQNVTVAGSTGPQLGDIVTTAEACGQKNGTISITPKNAIDPVDYSLNGMVFARTTDYSGLPAGNYTVSIRDTNSCVVTQTVLVALDCANVVHIPTAFSPNTDQLNDGLTIRFLFPSLTVSRFTVYDRWGTVIYNRANFVLLTGESVWDGKINGQLAPPGMYVYRMTCQFPDGTQTSYHNAIALLNHY